MSWNRMGGEKKARWTDLVEASDGGDLFAQQPEVNLLPVHQRRRDVRVPLLLVVDEAEIMKRSLVSHHRRYKRVEVKVECTYSCSRKLILALDFASSELSRISRVLNLGAIIIRSQSSIIHTRSFVCGRTYRKV